MWNILMKMRAAPELVPDDIRVMPVLEGRFPGSMICTHLTLQLFNPSKWKINSLVGLFQEWAGNIECANHRVLTVLKFDNQAIELRLCNLQPAKYCSINCHRLGPESLG